MNTFLVLLCLLSEAVSVNVVSRGDTRVDFNADASYTCTHADPTGVLQVTWQRLFKDDSVENLATYSKRFGAQIIDPHRGKVVFTEASLNSTSITVKNVTWADEACYICSFNVYPSGSRRKQTCLTVQGVSEVRATMHKVPSTEPKADMEVVVSCSATGKPAPWIQWNLSAAALIKTPNNWTVINKDQTVTANSNITLQLLPGSGGYVDCIVNNGMRTQRHERVLLPILPGEREVEKDDKRTSPWVVAVPVFLIISLLVILGCVELQKKKGCRQAALATTADEQDRLRSIV
ncbi:OX-2 membrane glycoprotein-like isoform X1 [Oncorhynchus tshawytscha]|uniref:OX-2 membrane glycoprotein-like isoform X1 n=1 Tax=Oncorhynchus tshawytscha TaxID=74940 RepID=UPI001C3D4B42|nr:OX-2 membrane glycoprotein-like isoform X1 [Oncorhynchus tshawytscha]